MAIDGVPRIRLAAIPTDALLVVRGDDGEVVLATDARRFRRRFAAWGRYGVSGFVARDAAEVDALCQTRLVAWGRVSVFRRAVLAGSGSRSSRRSGPLTSRSPTPSSASCCGCRAM